MTAGGGQGPILIDDHEVQLVELDILQVGVEVGVHHLQGLVGDGGHVGLLIAHSAAVHPRALTGQGHEVYIVHAQATQNGLLGKPGDVVHRQGAPGIHIVEKDLGQSGNLIHRHVVQAGLDNGLQEVLLGLDAAQVAVGIAAVNNQLAVFDLVVLTPAQQLHGLVAVDLLRTGLQVNVEVLGAVVIIHVVGHIEPHRADGIHQLAHGLPLHHHGEVRLEADQVGDLLLQIVDTVLVIVGGPVIDGVDLLDIPRHVDHGITGDVQHVELLIGNVVGHDHDGVGVAAAAGITAYHQEGVKFLLAVAGQLGSAHLHAGGGLSIRVHHGGDLRLDHQQLVGDKHNHNEGGDHR